MWIEGPNRRRPRPLLCEPSFAQLFYAISRRLTPVCQLYGEYGPSDEERFATQRGLCEGVSVAADLTALEWEREARARGRRHKLRGVLGSIRLEGDIEPFVDYLHLAQYAHVGKSAGFGLGRIRVVFGW